MIAKLQVETKIVLELDMDELNYLLDRTQNATHENESPIEYETRREIWTALNRVKCQIDDPM